MMVVRGLDYGFGSHVNPLIDALENLGVTIALKAAGGDMKALVIPLTRKTDADLIHFQGSYLNVTKLKTATISTVHTTIGDELRFTVNYKLRMAKQLEKRSLRNSDAIISVNPTLNKQILEQAPEARIHTIPNGVNTAEFNNLKPPRGNFLLSGGRLINRKNFITLTKALENTDLPPLRLFGDGPLDFIIKKTLREQDKLLGYIPRKDIIELYSTAQAFICPSLYETGPITVLEAMAARCPVICSDIPAVEEIVENGKTGLTFNPHDPEELRDHIETLLGDPKLQDDLAETAYNWVKKERNWQDIAKATLHVYEETIEGGETH